MKVPLDPPVPEEPLAQWGHRVGRDLRVRKDRRGPKASKVPPDKMDSMGR